MIDEEIDPRLEEHLRQVLRTIASHDVQPISARRSHRAPAMRLAAAALIVAALTGVVVAKVARTGELRISPQPTTGPQITGPSTDVPASSTALPTTTNVTTSLAAPMAIGDTVMLSAKAELEAHGVTVDASANRHAEDFIAELRALRSAGGIGETVVIQVGLNDAVTDDQLDQIVALLPRSLAPNLVFMTVQAPVSWIAGNNTRIRALPARYPWIKILDWKSLSADTQLCPDGIHVSCNPPGPAHYYATKILDVIASLGHDQTAS